MDVIVKPRQAGKTEDILQVAAEGFSCIVCANQREVEELWARSGRGADVKIPMPITWYEFVSGLYNNSGIHSFVIDNLDRCVQSMTTVEIKAVSLTGSAS